MDMHLAAVAPSKATTARRAGGYLIDALVSVFFSVAVSVLFGDSKVVAGVMMGAYWLLRDVAGDSIGKMVMGLTVVAEGGAAAGMQARMLRNVPLAIGPSVWIIPGVGVFLAGPIGGVILLVELLSLAMTGRRIGSPRAQGRFRRKHFVQR